MRGKGHLCPGAMPLVPPERRRKRCSSPSSGESTEGGVTADHRSRLITDLWCMVEEAPHMKHKVIK